MRQTCVYIQWKYTFATNRNEFTGNFSSSRYIRVRLHCYGYKALWNEKKIIQNTFFLTGECLFKQKFKQYIFVSHMLSSVSQINTHSKLHTLVYASSPTAPQYIWKCTKSENPRKDLRNLLALVVVWLVAGAVDSVKWRY